MFISYSPAEKKRALFFEFRTIIPLENHGFGDRPFLPFEVGRARANAMITLACLKLTTWLGCGSAVNEPIFAVLNQLANLNGLKGQLINLASILRRTYPRCVYLYTNTKSRKNIYLCSWKDLPQKLLFLLWNYNTLLSSNNMRTVFVFVTCVAHKK